MDCADCTRQLLLAGSVTKALAYEIEAADFSFYANFASTPHLELRTTLRT